MNSLVCGLAFIGALTLGGLMSKVLITLDHRVRLGRWPKTISEEENQFLRSTLVTNSAAYSADQLRLQRDLSVAQQETIQARAELNSALNRLIGHLAG